MISDEDAKKMGYTKGQMKVPVPIMPEDPGRLDIRSTF